MGLKLKNTSLVRETFGLTYGVFANNKAIKNNLELISILASRKSRFDAKKRALQSPNTNHKKILARTTNKSIKINKQ